MTETVVKAVQIERGIFYLLCPFCGDVHHHGTGTGASEPLGTRTHRLSHCWRVPTGEYLIDIVETAPTGDAAKKRAVELGVADGVSTKKKRWRS